MKGGIISTGCSVSVGDTVKIVNMGEFRSNQFAGVGSYSESIPFHITLYECKKEILQQLTITFKGIADGKDPLVFKSGEGDEVVSGVGLAILDLNGEIIPPNTPFHLAFREINEVSELHFSSRYRATSRQVSGGNANTLIWFSLSYE